MFHVPPQNDRFPGSQTVWSVPLGRAKRSVISLPVEGKYKVRVSEP